MQRVDAPEILDSDACPPAEVQAVLKVLAGINRRFGGVSTTQRMVERVARVAKASRLSLLEVAAGTGELPEIVRQNLARQKTSLDITLLDRAHSHLTSTNGGAKNRSVVGDALSLPFPDNTFDLVGCNLFAHHLQPAELAAFVKEGIRVSRTALLINDLVRHPLHLALVYVSLPLMRNRIAWLDGLTSVRRAYIAHEIRSMIASALPSATQEQVEISRHYFFRMGVIVWKNRRLSEVNHRT
jgi:ubiquinone/menaquinone biosynthesis C-methylase UbiE